MAERNNVVFSIIEYDIEMFSRVLPGQISHLGIRAEIYGEVREWNFGSFLDGQYEPVGIPGDPRDFLGGFRGQMGMRSTIVGSASVERGLGAALVDQIAAFASDLYNRQINYEPVPNRLGRQANSNSAAAYVMRMLGIDPNSLSYQGNPVGLNVDLSDRRFGLPSPGFYSGRAHADYLDWQYGDAVPTPAPRPTDLAPSVTSPVPQPSGVQQPPILSPINYVPGAPIGVSQTPATPITAPSAVFPMRRFQRRLSRLPRIQSPPRLSSTSSTRTRKNRHRSIRTSRRNRPKAANKVAAQTAIRTVAAAVAVIITAASTETAASAVPNRPPVASLRRTLAPAERAAGRLPRTRAPSRPERAAEAGAMAIAQAIPPGATGSAAPARRSAKTPADVVFSMKASATIIKRANPQAASAD